MLAVWYTDASATAASLCSSSMFVSYVLALAHNVTLNTGESLNDILGSHCGAGLLSHHCCQLLHRQPSTAACIALGAASSTDVLSNT